ncbi:MAG TPA: hypothetical protein VJ861_10570 [Treponemataceae bacterium]|nr:hypothetical protein [Treponemataceae bacterium]
MSDLFVGEILILLLLVPVLLRPFFKRLQRIEGIAILPLLSLLLAFGVIAAGGLRFSFLPVLLCLFIVFFANSIRMVHLFSGIPSDLYSIPSIILYVLLIIMFSGTLWCSIVFAPEPNRISENETSRSFYTESFSVGTKVRFSVWEPVKREVSNVEGLVIITNDSATGFGSRNSTASILSENGYIVIEGNSISTHDYINPLFLYPGIRKPLFLLSRLFPFIEIIPSAQEIAIVQEKSLGRLVSWTQNKFGKTLPLYIIAEGDSIPSVASFFRNNRDVFAGISCISNDLEIKNTFPDHLVFVFDASGGSLPSISSVYPVCIISGSDSNLEGLGEIDANDVLMSFLLGGSRDVNRMRAELIARRILSWIRMRSVYGFEGS